MATWLCYFLLEKTVCRGKSVAEEACSPHGCWGADGKTKKQFAAGLDEQIRKSIDCKSNYSELSYSKADEYKKISTLLLLFNVESGCLI